MSYIYTYNYPYIISKYNNNLKREVEKMVIELSENRTHVALRVSKEDIEALRLCVNYYIFRLCVTIDELDDRIMYLTDDTCSEECSERELPYVVSEFNDLVDVRNRYMAILRKLVVFSDEITKMENCKHE